MQPLATVEGPFGRAHKKISLYACLHTQEIHTFFLGKIICLKPKYPLILKITNSNSNGTAANNGSAGGNKDNSGNRDGGGHKQQSTIRGSGRNNGCGNWDVPNCNSNASITATTTAAMGETKMTAVTAMAGGTDSKQHKEAAEEMKTAVMVTATETASATETAKVTAMTTRPTPMTAH
jgi:hypothetical protein